ncbi:hypothetical protein B9Z55_022716 [Caenorhabditis nigoni]|uniref:Uncharacterized protein n=1 Tax=Caenorhabditis nigoni TaxID=1611254 RepID=A0A2G5SLE6_9PELO|nr:hypothetical protein B9Z55_022716 [Caenorhabditis nigoni]
MHVSLPRIQPHQSKSFPYWFTADTLCDEDHSPEHLSQPAILSVASALPAAFMLKVKAEDDFHLGHKVLETTASPSEPRFWLYTFPEYIEKINIRIVSDSDCPAFDATGLPEFSDVYFYQSFTKLGSFSLTKADMGKQVHIVYSIEPDDSVCDDGLQPIIPLVIYIIVIATVFVITYYQYKWLDRQENNEPNILDGTESEGTVFVDKISLFDKPNNTVSHKEYQKNKVIKESKYFNFLIFQLLGSVLPQLTILFQNNISKKKMKVDSCYLNYLCCSNFLGFNCFNGVISSSSLVAVGVVNLIIVFRKNGQ